MTPVEFLRSLQPSGPWSLGAIAPDAGARTWTTVGIDETAVREFVERHRDRNIYFQANLVSRDLGDRRAGKADVERAIALHADIDPPEGADLAAWQRDARRWIERWDRTDAPRPSVATFSGSGFQLLWRLDRPVALDGDDAIESVESRNRALADLFGGDRSTIDVSRLLRLPGTLNHPGERKRAKYGRSGAVMSEIVAATNLRYPLDLFAAKAAPDERRGDGAVAFSSSVGRFDAAARSALQRDLDAIGPEDGDNRTGRAAWLIFVDFGRSTAEGWPLLAAWNERRRQPHTERELRRRMHRALDHKADARRGDRVLAVKVRTTASSSDVVSRGARLDLVRMSDVQPEKIEWLWYGRVPACALTLFDGDPGLGKSTVVCDLAARVSTGRPMPFELHHREPADVILFTAEDHVSMTVRPRLDAAGADVSRVHVVRGVIGDDGCEDLPGLPTNFDELRDAIRDTGARFVAIDPVIAYVEESVNSHNDQDMRRRVLAPLARLAEETRVVVVALRHLRKASGSAIHRGGGSIAITGAARIAHTFGQDPGDETARVIACTKTNLGKMPRSVRFRVEGPDDGVGRIEWLDEVDDITADHLVGHSERVTRTDDASGWLAEFLADGRRKKGDVQTAAEARGYTERVLRDAAERLKVRKVRVGKPPDQVSWWSLPEKSGAR